MDYKKAYCRLFNDVTDTIEKLKAAQCEAEEILLGQDNEEEETAGFFSAKD